MKEQYDLIVSLGAACSCSKVLRVAGLQTCSFPMDWVSGSSFLQRVDIFLSDFADYLKKEDLEDQHVVSNSKKQVYLNTRLHIRFPHDFPVDVPLEASYQQVAEKYNRRVKRLFSLIEASASVLFVYLETPIDTMPHSTREEIEKAFQKIIDRYPSKKVNLRYITFNPDVPPDTFSSEKINDAILHIIGEYKSKKPNDKDYSVNIATCLKFMSDCRLAMPWRKRVGNFFVRIGLFFIPSHYLRKKYRHYFHLYTD